MNKQSISENQILYKNLKRLRVAIIIVALIAFLFLAGSIIFLFKMLGLDLGSSDRSRMINLASIILSILLIAYFIFCVVRRLIFIGNMLQEVALEGEKWIDEIRNLQTKNIVYVVVFMIISSTVFLVSNIGTQLKWSEQYMDKNVRDCEDVVSEWITEGDKLFFAVEYFLENEELDNSTGESLNKLIDKTELVSNIYIYSKEVVVSKDGIYEGKIPEGVIDAYNGALSTERDVYITQPYNSFGYLVITLSKAVYSEDGTLIGVVCIDCDVARLNVALSTLYENNGYAFIIDKEGNIINHPHKRYQMTVNSKTSVKDAGYQKILNTHKSVLAKDYNGEYVVCKKYDEFGIDYSIVVARKWDVVYGRVFVSIITVVCISIIIIFIMISVLTKFNMAQQRISNEIEENARKAESASKAKSEFIANITHEVRTPINAIIGMNEMVYNETDQMEIKEYAKDVHTASRKLLALINSILDFSTLEANELELCSEEYKLASAVGDIVDIVDDKIRQKNLEFEVNVDENLPSELKGDVARIRMIVNNLLTNAIRATDEGKITLDIKFSKKENNKVYVYFSVTDTGCGIKAEDMNKLFDSFERLEDERYHSGEGAGLGLAISDRLLKMMGSGLKVNSMVGEGSRFYFTIAQEIVSEESVGDYHVAISLRDVEEVKNTVNIVSGTRVLVVDDTEMNIDLVKKFLKKFKVVVDSAGSAKEAIELLKKDYYDIVLMDYMMPVMDGVEALKHIKEEHIADETPFIAMTAYVVSGAKQMFMDAGFTDYLAKPFRSIELETIISKHVTKESNITKLKEILPEIDVVAGLSFCGDSEEFYEDMLGEFVEGNRLAEIEEYYKEENWEMYRISVHSLKGTSLLIGLNDFSEETRLVETSVKEGNVEYAKEHHEAMIKHYEKILDAIWQMFDE